MLTRVRFLSILAIALLGLFSAVGCSRLPTQPSAVEVSGAVPAVLIDVLPESPPSDPNPMVEGAPVVSASSARLIRGRSGGAVAAGDFRVVVPAQAFTGNATITVTQRDVTKPVVELSISPASKNKFRFPVTLIANVAKADGSQLSATCLSWYDPATITWTPVAGSAVNPVGLTVQAPLAHFSTYRVENSSRSSW